MDGGHGEAVSAMHGPVPEDERAVRRVLIWLVVVPFTLPMWLALRRRRPDLAEPIVWAAWFNAAQSVVFVALVALACWAVVVLPPLFARLVASYVGG